jgi:hypothetical protein
METKTIAILLSLSCLTGSVACAAGVEAYNVVWESPSRDHHGSMPLGNGDIGVNAWVTAAGDVHLLVSKTDAWDDNARLVKVGAMRIHFEPNPFADNPPFRQTLSLADATLKIEAGTGARRVRVQVWVDANLPVIHMTAEGASPLEVTAATELWRTRQHELRDLQVSDVLLNRRLPTGQQAPLVIEPDTVLTGQRDRIGWYHHNIKSTTAGRDSGSDGLPPGGPAARSHVRGGRDRRRRRAGGRPAPALAARDRASSQHFCSDAASGAAAGMAGGDGADSPARRSAGFRRAAHGS